MTAKRSLLQRLRDWILERVPGMLSCKELDESMVDYIDGVLPASERRKFTLHLLFCTTCRRYLSAYRRTITLCAESVLESDDDAEDEVPEALVQAIVSSARTRSERR